MIAVDELLESNAPCRRARVTRRRLEVDGAGSANLNREAIEITDRASWRALRRRDLTASRIAVLFDRHPFLTRGGLAAQLRGKGRRFDNVHMRAGRILAPSRW